MIVYTGDVSGFRLTRQLNISMKNQMDDMKDESAVHYPARYWHEIDDGQRIYCDLCPRACKLKDGDRGFCFVRRNEGNKMVLTTYGLSTGFCIDPIEKKPLNHFLPGTSVLSFGTAGCNLGCQFCQNWSISKSREIELLSEKAGPEDIARAAQRLGCRSVAFTYNDPVIWAEYAIDVAKACHEVGLKTVAVTAGYITPEVRPEFYSVMDAANVDLKAFTELFYEKTTLAHLAPVLDTLRWLKHESNVWFEITNLMIPGHNDSVEEVEQMVQWISSNLGLDVPLHFTAFHPDFRMTDIPPTPPSTLTRARDQALAAGLKYVYTGNVNDKSRQSTYCPSCSKCVIERNWHELGQYRIRDGKCDSCQTPVAGIFEDTKGDWGRRRLPVVISNS
ncbi:MAG TPA: AmmeMemoRadiSam system radical SAM enzyme [Oculatellaceae cyanobacterium]